MTNRHFSINNLLAATTIRQPSGDSDSKGKTSNEKPSKNAEIVRKRKSSNENSNEKHARRKEVEEVKTIRAQSQNVQMKDEDNVDNDDDECRRFAMSTEDVLQTAAAATAILLGSE